jgi:GNAT superfamily N-acetyltransferase
VDHSESFAIREAGVDDASAVALLHVQTFRETHGGPGPSVAVREAQWREILAEQNETSFCFVIVRENGELVGFARGIPHRDDPPGFDGQLNKIYVLRAYHRRGLGRLLVGCVARRFLQHGIGSMLLFGDAANPSNGFYEAMGAERLYAPNGDFHGGYGWRDLRALAE